MFASQISHRLFSYDNYRENNTIRNVLGVWIFSFLPADFILIMMDNHFITSGTLIQKQRCIGMSEKTKIKRTKKKLWNSEIVYFSWSSMLFIFSSLKINLSVPTWNLRHAKLAIHHKENAMESLIIPDFKEKQYLLKKTDLAQKTQIGKKLIKF